MTEDKIIQYVTAYLNTHGSDNEALKNLTHIFEGEYWNSGGNCMLATIPISSHLQIIVSTEVASVYINPWEDTVSEEDFKYINIEALPKGQDDFPRIDIWRYNS